MDFIDIPVNIPDNLKARADKYGINIGDATRKFLHNKVMDIECLTLDEDIRRAQKYLAGKITPEEVVALIRESRGPIRVQSNTGTG